MGEIYDVFLRIYLYFCFRFDLILQAVYVYTIFAFGIEYFYCIVPTDYLSMNLWDWPVLNSYPRFGGVATNKINSFEENYLIVKISSLTFHQYLSSFIEKWHCYFSIVKYTIKFQLLDKNKSPEYLLIYIFFNKFLFYLWRLKRIKIIIIFFCKSIVFKVFVKRYFYTFEIVLFVLVDQHFRVFFLNLFTF